MAQKNLRVILECSIICRLLLFERWDTRDDTHYIILEFERMKPTKGLPPLAIQYSYAYHNELVSNPSTLTA